MQNRDATEPALNGNKVEKKPWVGRLFLLLGVVLLGLSLRHAVTAVSPLLSTIQSDIGLHKTGATILGMLPTIAFEDFGQQCHRRI